MGCFTRDRTSPNAASVTSSLARVYVFRERGGSNLACVRRLFFTTLPMALCENSILSISFFPFSFFFFVRSLPIASCSFCIRSKYRSLLTGLITSTTFYDMRFLYYNFYQLSYFSRYPRRSMKNDHFRITYLGIAFPQRLNCIFTNIHFVRSQSRCSSYYTTI